MKKVFILLIAITLSGCCTTKYVEVPMKIELDNTKLPQRQELPAKNPDQTTDQVLLNRVVYYNTLVKEWESWAIYIYQTLDLPVPESLQYLLTNK